LHTAINGAFPYARGADKSLAFPTFLFAAQPKEFFLGWVKEVRTTKS
jgi:hypothetical protein